MDRVTSKLVHTVETANGVSPDYARGVRFDLLAWHPVIGLSI